MLTLKQRNLRQELVKCGKQFHTRGWSLASSSNYSVLLEEDKILITASGKNKGELRRSDFLVVNNKGRPVGQYQVNPSAETLLHCQLYNKFSGVRAVLHTHSLYSTLLTVNSKKSSLTIKGFEMQKALSDITTHKAELVIPIIKNNQNVAEMTIALKDKLNGPPAYLIAGHGLYTWAASLQQAYFQIEALEFLLECEYKKRLLK